MKIFKITTLFFILTTLFFSCSVFKKSTEAPKKSYIEISTTQGKMIFDLYDKTPLHKANFIKLANEKFYDNTLFHRVIKGFMIQGGDPDSKNAPTNKALGNGGPGYQIPAEFDTSYFHKKGILAAARTNNPEKKSSGSQFYIVQGNKYSLAQLNNMEIGMQRRNPGFKFTNAQKLAYTTIGGTPHLDGDYTVFGEMISGMDVLDKIASVKKNRALGNRPVEDIKMTVKVIFLSEKEVIALKEKK